MIELDKTDERIRVRTRGLGLRFDWTGDRWIHAIEVGSTAQAGPVVFSVEASGEIAEPGRIVSPTYQQLHAEHSSSEARLYVVGQEGRHHFSAVFFVRVVGASTQVEVDAADRFRGDVAALASTYRVVLEASTLFEGGPDRLAWRREEWGPDALSFGPGVAPATAARISVAEAGRVGMIVQAQAALVAGQQTQRWAYTWRWGSGGGGT